MASLNPFKIPIRGLKPGEHRYEYQLNLDFFEEFEDSPIQEANIDVVAVLDKRPDMVVLDILFNGTFPTECDRCLSNIQLPIEGEQQLLIKYAEEEDKVDDPDIVYISPEATEINIAQYIYEFVNLSVPIIKVYDCEAEEPKPCNEDTLHYLENKEDAPVDNPIWDELKKLKK